MKIHITRTFLNRILLPFLLLLILCRCTKNNTTNSNSIVNQIDRLIEYAADTSKTNQERIESFEKVDSLITILLDDSTKVKKYLDISSKYHGLIDEEKLKKIDEKALKLALKINDSIGIARSHSHMGMYYRYFQLDSAFYHFYKAEKIYNSFDKDKNKDSRTPAFNYGVVLIDLAQLFRRIKNYNESEALAIKSIKKFVTNQFLFGFKRIMSNCHDFVA